MESADSIHIYTFKSRIPQLLHNASYRDMVAAGFMCTKKDTDYVLISNRLGMKRRTLTRYVAYATGLKILS